MARRSKKVAGGTTKRTKGEQARGGHLELPADQLRWTCSSKDIRLTAGRNVRLDVGTVGQDRALDALHLGVTMDSPGYNIYVCGDPGTGRTSAVKAVLKELTPTWSRLYDRCYVYNFRDPDRPQLLTLPPGEGRAFKKAMANLVAGIRRSLPRAFEDSAYRKRRQEVVTKYKSREKELWTKFEEGVRKKDFVVVQLQDGPVTRQDVLPVIDGKPCTSSQLSQLVESGRLAMKDVERLTKIYLGFQPRLRSLVKKSRVLERELVAKMEALETEVTLAVVQELEEGVRERFAHKAVHKYLDDVLGHIVENLDVFKNPEQEEMQEDGSDARGRFRDPFMPYEVNVVLDNTDTKGAPVVVETSPTFSNLFGTIERIERGGVWRSDFTGIRGGSMLRADGGFLVLNVIDIITEPRLWMTLKRMLKNRQLEIHEPEFISPNAPTALKPEPIDLKLKVLMIGQSLFYHLMMSLDEDFAKIFKVKAEFDSEMAVSRSNLDHFVGVVQKIAKEENLRRFEKDALARLVEYAVRMAGRQGKLTTRFSEVANLMREANYWAGQMNRKVVDGKVFRRAVDEMDRRHDLAEEKIQEMIDDKQLLIDVTGQRTGQINGLAVYTLGRHMFGRPSRITATVSVGRGGIVNIERESEMSGSTHDKGVLILGGYLRRRFGGKMPLSIEASLCFEQSYSGVDGDSASSTEIYALLSALSGLPIRQDVAVTGSMNQLGDIQPIGGVNEKVEGFYQTCVARGKLTGKQGVIIPWQNVQNLMLDEEVVDAVRRGRFHIWPVRTIDQGIEILTGCPAGERLKDGSFPEGTVNGLVAKRLAEFAETLREYDGAAPARSRD